LANQIVYGTEYKKSIAEVGISPGKYLDESAGEWFQGQAVVVLLLCSVFHKEHPSQRARVGLPTGWTNAASSVNPSVIADMFADFAYTALEDRIREVS